MPEPLFPSLYGNDPGDPSTEKAQDITDQPLPSMMEEGAQLTSGSSIQPLGTGGEPIPQLEGAGAPETTTEIADPPEDPRRPKRRSVQDRIDQLTFRVHQRGAENDILREENARLSAQISELGAQINAVLHRPMNQNPNPLENPAAAGNPNGSSDVESAVARAIQQHVAPLSQAVGQMVTNTQLATQHQASFAQAAEEFPDLSDPRSNFARVFTQLWASTPLRELKNGPYQVALQVRGILADARADEKRQAAQKRAASVHVPQSTIPEQASGSAPTQGDARQFAELSHRIKNGDTSFDTYRAWRTLREKFKKR